jgi:hypothetical protein
MKQLHSALKEKKGENWKNQLSLGTDWTLREFYRIAYVTKRRNSLHFVTKYSQ